MGTSISLAHSSFFKASQSRKMLSSKDDDRMRLGRKSGTSETKDRTGEIPTKGLACPMAGMELRLDTTRRSSAEDPRVASFEEKPHRTSMLYPFLPQGQRRLAVIHDMPLP
jgi:hypothetical protein